MFKIAILVWVMLGTTLAGVALMSVLMLPNLAGQAMNTIPLAVFTGFTIAMPLSYLVARKIAGASAR